MDGFPVEDPNQGGTTGATGASRAPLRTTPLGNMYPCQYIICELQIHLAELYTFSQSITFRLDLDNKLSSALVDLPGTPGLAKGLEQELGVTPAVGPAQGPGLGLGLGQESPTKIEADGMELTSNTQAMYEKLRSYFLSAQNNARKLHRRLRTLNKINQTFSAPNELELFMEVGGIFPLTDPLSINANQPSTHTVHLLPLVDPFYHLLFHPSQ